MSWSLVKESALRHLRPVGSEYAAFMSALSDADDENVPAVVEQLQQARREATQNAA